MYKFPIIITLLCFLSCKENPSNNNSPKTIDAGLAPATTWFQAWELVAKETYGFNTLSPVELVLFDEKFVYTTSKVSPSVLMIEKYIFDSSIYVTTVESQIMGVVVLFPLSKTFVEIKNIAVAETHQGKGFGKQLLAYAIEKAREQGYQHIQIGTANSSIGQLALYQKMGFEMDHIRKAFFTDNYPETMYENGILVRDMIVLKKKLG